MIRHRQAGDLDRILCRHELQQLERDAVGLVSEPGPALAVMHHIFAGVFADRQRGWTPQFAGVIIPDVEHLARRIGHRIVRPGGEQVHLAVDGPGTPRSRFRDQTPEARIGNHVDPRGRRPLPGAEHGPIFAAVRREAPEPVEELELGGGDRGPRLE